LILSCCTVTEVKERKTYASGERFTLFNSPAVRGGQLSLAFGVWVDTCLPTRAFVDLTTIETKNVR
jgi:hypothetical protein